MKVLCIVEKLADYHNAKKHLFQLGKKGIYLANTPAIANYISKQNDEIINPTQYFDAKDHSECSDFVMKILDFFYSNIDKSIEFSHSYCQYMAFHSQFYLNYVSYHTVLIDNFLKEKASEVDILIFSNENDVLPFLKIQSTERPINHLLGQFAKVYNLNIIGHQYIEENPKLNFGFFEGIFSSLLDTVQSFCFSLVYNKANFLVTSATLKKFKQLLIEQTDQHTLYIHSGEMCFERPKDRVSLRSLKSIVDIILQTIKFSRTKSKDSYDFEYSLLPIVNNQDSELPHSMKAYLEKIQSKMEEHFKLRDLNIYSLYKKKFEAAFLPAVKNLFFIGERLKFLTSKLESPLMISPYSIGTSSILGEIAINSSYKHLLMGHGMIPAPQRKELEKELYYIGRNHINAVYENVVIQSKLETEHLNYFNTKKNTFVTGPLVWGVPEKNTESPDESKKTLRAKWNIPMDAQVVLHGSTQKPNHSFRLNSYETPFEYVENIIILFDQIKENKDKYLVVKFRPDPNLSTEDLKDLLPKHPQLVIETECPFVSALHASDVLVSFSSTTIIEAINNNIPILMFGGDNRFPFSQESNESLYFVDDRKKIIPILNKLGGKKDLSKEKEMYLVDENQVLPIQEIINRI